jgi:TetR/AcrR family transcriptional repressor of nem operon
MKKSKAETAKTRQRIVEIASETIRNQGIDATGVAEIMAKAGLTHGGFYRHFDSKEDLVREAIALSRRDYLGGIATAADSGPEALLEHFQEYVSQAYRDDVGGGCPLAANGSEIVRSDARVRHGATEAFRTWFGKAAPYMRSRDDESRNDMAINLVTNMIGALLMSRIVDDPALSDKILEAARRRISNAIDLSASKPGAHTDAAKPKAKARARASH